jgi:FkbM family methyltransferase
MRSGLSRVARKIRARLSKPDAVSVELNRLANLERLSTDATYLPGCRFAVADGPAFVSQWQAIFMQEHYAFVANTARPRILDCGANVGLAALYWVRNVPGARIAAFEPDPALAALLRTNLMTCGAGHVEVVEAAVLDRSGEAEFATGSPDAGRLQRDRHRTSVRTVRLRDYLEEHVALLKLDIEGAELDVLRDCAGRLDRVARLFVEFHSFEDREQRLDELVSILTDAGFRLHVVSELASPQPFLRRTPYLGMDLQLNIYAFRE